MSLVNGVYYVDDPRQCNSRCICICVLVWCERDYYWPSCRDCWPVYDKKLEQQFRKTCSNWIARIAKVHIYGPLGGSKTIMFLSHFCDNLHCAHCNIFQVTSFLIVNSTLFLMTRKHQSLGFPVCPPPSFSLQEVGSCVRNFLQRCSISYVCVSQCKLATCRIAAFLVPMITGLKLLLS